MASTIFRRFNCTSMQWMATGVRAIVSRAFALVLVGADIVDAARSRKKVIIFGLLGSKNGMLTGVCTKAYLTSYKNNIDKFKAKGIDLVICVSINDPYVMNGWAEKLEAKKLTLASFNDNLVGVGPRVNKIRLVLNPQLWSAMVECNGDGGVLQRKEQSPLWLLILLLVRLLRIYNCDLHF
ncbi:hypothetical protein NE237_010999 [Protea cynaroides]|uniref:Glutaredoxin-dependent peroxiredoxin n=1 Tax=Protea cynaroides TaxID=273540 RepID=A0A9Q0R238_9MAGN|nr:hypothetical protein NE237_010999 [Protea cynaroides]